MAAERASSPAAGARDASAAGGHEPEQSGASERMQRLRARLAQMLGEPLTGGLEQLSSGASRETFALATPSRGRLVLQLEHRAGHVPARPPQAPLLRAAATAGVPVPEVVADGLDDPLLGPSWTLVRALAGTSDPRAILAGEGVPQAEALLDQIAAALAAVHRIEPGAAPAPARGDTLGELRATLDALGEPHPTFELALRALRSGRPEGVRGFVHGDFRMGNLMADAGGLTGVLDWELAHLGDPVEDLGWLCVPAWRFARPDRPAAGLGTREQLLAAYARHSGRSVDPQALRWWELAGTLRWGVICVMQAFRHLSGGVRSIEHAVIGRRACEVEWDLLEMLDPQPAHAPEAAHAPEPAEHPQPAHAPQPAQAPEPAQHPAPPQAPEFAQAPPPARAFPQAPNLHDRPTAIELLDAARSTLGEDVLPLLEGRPAFELRVTMRALGIVRRELEHAAEHERAHAQALASLGVSDEHELARAIREGRLQERGAELRAALRVTVAAKLQAANPRYPALAGLARSGRTGQTTKGDRP